MAIPIIKLIPIPPRLLIDDTATAIKVRTKADIGVLHLL